MTLARTIKPTKNKQIHNAKQPQNEQKLTVPHIPLVPRSGQIRLKNVIKAIREIDYTKRTHGIVSDAFISKLNSISDENNLAGAIFDFAITEKRQLRHFHFIIIIKKLTDLKLPSYVAAFYDIALSTRSLSEEICALMIAEACDYEFAKNVYLDAQKNPEYWMGPNVCMAMIKAADKAGDYDQALSVWVDTSKQHNEECLSSEVCAAMSLVAKKVGDHEIAEIADELSKSLPASKPRPDKKPQAKETKQKESSSLSMSSLDDWPQPDITRQKSVRFGNVPYAASPATFAGVFSAKTTKKSGKDITTKLIKG